MHFSVPKSTLVQPLDPGKEGHVTYDVHVNSLFHCSVRYSKLLELHEALGRKRFQNNVVLPAFPPKRLLPLSDPQLEQRRVQLEKYLQQVSQIPQIRKTDPFCSFLLSAQWETYERNLSLTSCTGNCYSPAFLEVEAPTGPVVRLDCSETKARCESSGQVLTRVGDELRFPRGLHKYFGLVVARKGTKDGEEKACLSIVRILEDYEAPWVTLRNMDAGVKILMRRRFWDADQDVELLRDPVGLNLRYCEAVADVENGWCPVPPNVEAHLTQMRNRGSKRQYLDLIRSQRFFGYWRFSDPPCCSDYPGPGDSPVIVRVGDRELVLEAEDGSVSCFKVTRMRCWRISGSASEEPKGETAPPELSFEYLVGRDKMDWIAVKCPQAVLISLCLQGIVDELLEKQRGPPSAANEEGAPAGGGKEGSGSGGGIAGWLANKLSRRSAVNGEGGGKIALVQNAVFHEIGDDDL